MPRTTPIDHEHAPREKLDEYAAGDWMSARYLAWAVAVGAAGCGRCARAA